MNVFAAAQTFNEIALRKNWNQFCDPSLSFTDPTYTELLTIWRQKAGGRKMPTRTEMTARDLKNFLRNIIVVQRERKDDVSHYRWRLIGTDVTSIVGHNTGKMFDETVPPEHLSRWIQCCDMVLESEQPWRFLGRVHIQDREYLNAEHLYMPLTDENGAVCFMMGYCRYASRFQDNDMSDEEMASLPRAIL
jgi:hypothetical protein